jgi:hypothetical protein
MKAPTWKLALAVATVCALFVAVDIGLKSNAATKHVSAKPVGGVAPTTFVTAPIAAADASVSSYGLDNTHNTDW